MCQAQVSQEWRDSHMRLFLSLLVLSSPHNGGTCAPRSSLLNSSLNIIRKKKRKKELWASSPFSILWWGLFSLFHFALGCRAIEVALNGTHSTQREYCLTTPEFERPTPSHSSFFFLPISASTVASEKREKNVEQSPINCCISFISTFCPFGSQEPLLWLDFIVGSGPEPIKPNFAVQKMIWKVALCYCRMSKLFSKPVWWLSLEKKHLLYINNVWMFLRGAWLLWLHTSKSPIRGEPEA